MKRSSVSPADIAELNNLYHAFGMAARGKRGRPEVQAFEARIADELAKLRAGIIRQDLSFGPPRRFRIYDPKPRLIVAPSFPERVFHHALMTPVSPVLDRALVFDSYACREGKGALAAVKRVQSHLRRWPWFAQIDIRSYFASIDHDCLQRLLAGKFKNRDLLATIEGVLRRTDQADGLPIGTLVSQHLANFYLAGFDRFLLEQCRVRGMVRYMDDIVWWSDSRSEVRKVLQVAKDYLADELRLTIKTPWRVGRSSDGLQFCGYRIQPFQLLLNRRRKHRYRIHRSRWENAALNGEAGTLDLQAGYASAHALTIHAHARGWRRDELQNHPVAPALAAL